MKANEFVKKHGWDAVISAVKSTNAEETAAFEGTNLDPILSKSGETIGFDVKVYRTKYEEVKRLVESYELVSIHGLENSKEIVANAPSDEHFYSWTLGNSGVRDKTVNIGELRKAIADVESVESLKEVT